MATPSASIAAMASAIGIAVAFSLICCINSVISPGLALRAARVEYRGSLPSTSKAQQQPRNWAKDFHTGQRSRPGTVLLVHCLYFPIIVRVPRLLVSCPVSSHSFRAYSIRCGKARSAGNIEPIGKERNAAAADAVGSRRARHTRFLAALRLAWNNPVTELPRAHRDRLYTGYRKRATGSLRVSAANPLRELLARASAIPCETRLARNLVWRAEFM